MVNPTTPAPLEPATCPDCGGKTQQAFGPSRNYVSCTRCGHVFPSKEA